MIAINKIQYNISRDTTDALEKIVINVNIEYCGYGRVRDLTVDDDLELRERAHYELHKAIDGHSGFHMTNGEYSFDAENSVTEEEDNFFDDVSNVVINSWKNQKQIDYILDINNFTNQGKKKPFVLMEDVDVCVEHNMARALWRNPVKWFDRDGEHNIWMAHSTKQAKKVDNEYCRESIDIEELDNFLSHKELLV